MSIRSRKPGVTLLLLVLLLSSVFVLALATGPSGIGLRSLFVSPGPETTRSATGPDMAQLIVLYIRLPRVVLATLVGAALGAAGGVMQGVFRNPLADPGLIGVSPGAALGAAFVIVEGARWPGAGGIMQLGVPVGGMAGAFIMTAILNLLALRGGGFSTSRLILAGVALGAFAASLTGILTYRANDSALRDLAFWSMGSLAGAYWQVVVILLPLVLVSLILLIGLSRPLNLLLCGEENAALMGCHVRRTKWLSMLAVTLAVGPCVAFSGVIGFVGVVVPHIVRLFAGPDHRFLVPACALLGAALLICADMIARIIAAPSDVPVGIVTAALGAPAFLWFLLRTRDGDLPS
ncbi:ferrichrome Fe3+-siderophore transporter permease protein FecCD [Swaminathania salitolerans LMG 21291]|nr:ferrichrome Fe3+-siderophore transporter permease protein FecCD [Swaminathania salitolerans LMG 21291]